MSLSHLIITLFIFLNITLAQASDNGVLAFAKDYWWVAAVIPAIILFKKLLQKLESNDDK